MSSSSANFLLDKKKGERESIRKLASKGARDKGDASSRMAREIMMVESMINDESDDDDEEEEQQQQGFDPSTMKIESFDHGIEMAEMCMAHGAVAPALTAAEKALPLARSATDKAAAHDLLGLILMEIPERVAEARDHFSEAEKLTPGKNYERYLNMAQLTDGATSRDFFQMGLDAVEELMRALPAQTAFEDESITEDRTHYSRVASQAMTSMADLYLTELCDEECAESECTRLLKTAITTCPSNAEAFRSLASLSMIQGNAEKSIKFILHAHKLLTKQREERAEPVEFMTRVSVAELLLKLEQWPESAELLNSLLDEDDQIAELWSHAGVAHANLALLLADPAQTREYQYAAAQYFVSALNLLKQAPDATLEESITQQLRALEDVGVDLSVVRKTMEEQEKAANAPAEEGGLDDIDSDSEDDGAGQAMGE